METTNDLLRRSGLVWPTELLEHERRAEAERARKWLGRLQEGLSVFRNTLSDTIASHGLARPEDRAFVLERVEYTVLAVVRRILGTLSHDALRDNPVLRIDGDGHDAKLTWQQSNRDLPFTLSGVIDVSLHEAFGKDSLAQDELAKVRGGLLGAIAGGHLVLPGFEAANGHFMWSHKPVAAKTNLRPHVSIPNSSMHDAMTMENLLVLGDLVVMAHHVELRRKAWRDCGGEHLQGVDAMTDEDELPYLPTELPKEEFEALAKNIGEIHGLETEEAKTGMRLLGIVGIH